VRSLASLRLTDSYRLDTDHPRIEFMLKSIAALASLPFMNVIAVPAYADPGGIIDPGANYHVFLQAIAGDGIVIDGDQAIREGVAVCMLVHPPNNASLWDAGQHVLLSHPDWRIESALRFANRAIQDICPNEGSF